MDAADLPRHSGGCGRHGKGGTLSQGLALLSIIRVYCLLVQSVDFRVSNFEIRVEVVRLIRVCPRSPAFVIMIICSFVVLRGPHPFETQRHSVSRLSELQAFEARPPPSLCPAQTCLSQPPASSLSSLPDFAVVFASRKNPKLLNDFLPRVRKGRDWELRLAFEWQGKKMRL